MCGSVHVHHAQQEGSCRLRLQDYSIICKQQEGLNLTAPVALKHGSKIGFMP